MEDSALMAVSVSTEGSLQLRRPKRLFESEDLRSSRRHATYDVSPNGERFLTATPAEQGANSDPVIRTVQNWYEEFRERDQD